MASPTDMINLSEKQLKQALRQKRKMRRTSAMNKFLINLLILIVSAPAIIFVWASCVAPESQMGKASHQFKCNTVHRNNPACQ